MSVYGALADRKSLEKGSEYLSKPLFDQVDERGSKEITPAQRVKDAASDEKDS